LCVWNINVIGILCFKVVVWRLLYNNGCGDGSCGCGHSGCGWGIISITIYNLTEFNSRCWTIVSSTPLRSSLSFSCAEIKHGWPWYNNWTTILVAWVGRRLLIFWINYVNVIYLLTYRNIGFAYEYIHLWIGLSAI